MLKSKLTSLQFQTEKGGVLMIVMLILMNILMKILMMTFMIIVMMTFMMNVMISYDDSDQFTVPDKEGGVMPVFPMVVRQADNLLLPVLVPGFDFDDHNI